MVKLYIIIHLKKISKQLGDAKLLHQLTKNKIFFNFRKNDILNGGEGAPLTPLYHQLIISKKKLTYLFVFLTLEVFQISQ